jgi:MarR family 2-MHQ and catechol resistance regulon transcriptional repressor
MNKKRHSPAPPTSSVSEFVKKMSPCPNAKEEMPLPSSILAHICLLNSVLERSGDRMTAQHGLTMTQWFALGCVGHSEEKGVSHSELGQRLMLSKAPITGVVDRLEKGGFVVRVADARDRRISRVKITPKGTESWLAVRDSLREVAESTCQGFGEAELRETESLLARLLENVARTDPTLCCCCEKGEATDVEKVGDTK